MGPGVMPDRSRPRLHSGPLGTRHVHRERVDDASGCARGRGWRPREIGRIFRLWQTSTPRVSTILARSPSNDGTMKAAPSRACALSGPATLARSRLIALASARLLVHDVTDVAWAARRLENAKDGSLWLDWAVERCSLAPSLADMTEFVFDPPLRLKRDVTVRTLDDAADFTRKYVGSKLPLRRDGVLHGLEGASGYEEERNAANDFQAWAEAEGLLLGRG
jgi:hypothetical protein